MKISIIITFLIVFAMSISLIFFPVYAEPVTGSILGDWLLAGVIGGAAWDYVKQSVTAFYNEIVYDGNPPHLNCNHDWQAIGFGGKSDGTFYETFRCSICGDTANVEREALNQAYDDYVSQMDSTIVYGGSEIQLDFHLASNSLSALNSAVNSGYVKSFDYGPNYFNYILGKYTSQYSQWTWRFWNNSLSVITSSFQVADGMYKFRLPPLEGYGRGIYKNGSYCYFYLQRLVDGSWSQVQSFSFSSSYPKITSTSLYDLYSYKFGTTTSSYSLLSGVSYRFLITFSEPTYDQGGGPASLTDYPRGFSCSGISVIPQENSSTNPSSSSDRPSSGDYAYYSNGILVYAPNNMTIINESGNTFTNPVTENCYDLSGWTYDYSTRTYNATTTDNENVSVTYGNQYVTINEGNNIYNVYYVVQSPQEPTAPCSHEFVGDPDNPPIPASCVTAGVVNSICSYCGKTKMTFLDPLGHDWEWVETIEPEEGNEEEQQLFDLYQCRRCGVTRTVRVDSSVNDSGGGSGPGLSWWEQFKTWLGGRFDAVISAIGAGGFGNTEINNVTVTNNTVIITGSDGENYEVDIPNIISRFGWFRQAWALGTYFIQTVSSHEQAAYEYAELMDAEGESSGNPYGAPSIKINLGAAQSQYGYNYGGEVEALDLSWYTPYKRTVDNIVSGFLWLLLLWNIFRHAPGIIGGAGLTSNRLDDLHDGSRQDRRSRK